MTQAIPVLVSARLNSARLARKCLLDLGGISVISHIIKRCFHFGLEPVLCCPKEDVQELMLEVSCPVFGMTTDNCEELVIAAANNIGVSVFHHIDGDDPFFDRDSVIESMQCFMRGKFSRIRPSVYSQSGCGMVGTSYNLKAPSDSGIGILPDPATAVWPLRLTLDYPEDYHLILAVNRILGGYMTPWKAVEDLFIRNPDLHKINWFRNSEWKARQNDEKHSQPVRDGVLQ